MKILFSLVILFLYSISSVLAQQPGPIDITDEHSLLGIQFIKYIASGVTGKVVRREKRIMSTEKKGDFIIMKINPIYREGFTGYVNKMIALLPEVENQLGSWTDENDTNMTLVTLNKNDTRTRVLVLIAYSEVKSTVVFNIMSSSLDN